MMTTHVSFRRPFRFAATMAVVGWTFANGSTVEAQLGVAGADSRYELSETVELDRAEGEVVTHIERAKAFLADGQWDEAVATLREVMENSGDRLWPITDRRFITVRDYCHLQLAALPPEALTLYRARVDATARHEYEQGVARRDRRLLARVVRQMFVSRWGDDALLALGELALESGDTAAARSYWQRILPVGRPAEETGAWLGYPDSPIEPAAVRARLVLASILEGSRGRAEDELEAFARLHPDARGRIGGRDTNYVEALRVLLAESAQWSAPTSDADWPTFAGTPWRAKIAPKALDVGEVAWRFSLDGAERVTPVAGTASLGQTPPPFHPIRLGNLVLVAQQSTILALDLRSGRPAWGSSAAVFRAALDASLPRAEQAVGTLGSPHYTLTAFGGRLYARIGDPLTSRPREGLRPADTSSLVCLDLEAEGRLMWKVDAPRDGWAFEGSPVCDGRDVFVAMRRDDIRPQVHVACFDAQTGRDRWRRFVCAAETPARWTLAECTHNLLTLRHDTLYYNTNLGAVAALSTDRGQVQWISLYPRARSGNLAQPRPHLARSLTPCLYHHGTLLVAPSDSARILGLDAATGQILWQTGSEVEDVVNLLGVSGDRLIASGSRLYWIALDQQEQGRVIRMWPQANTGPGYGRGVLAGDRVYWPTRDRICVFDQSSGEMTGVIELAAKDVAGGNLLAVDGHLLIATPRELVALTRSVRPPEPAPQAQASVQWFEGRISGKRKVETGG